MPATNKQIPVIFLAFANDRDDTAQYLRNLPIELRGIRTHLQKAVKLGLCEVIARANVTIDEIFDVFQSEEYRDRIAIFHYGGHATSYQLLLESAEGHVQVASTHGLVNFFAKQKGLKLVCFNGCSSQNQAKDLSDAGIPIVVGTSMAISDEIATNLSIRFFRGLAEGTALAKAWAESVDQVKTKNDTSQTRGLRLRRDKSDDWPWHFYVREGAEVVKDWNLPMAVKNPLFGLPDLPRRNLPEQPFRYLERYSKEHAEIFFGRGQYIRDMYKRATDEKGAPIILFYGQSGVGKSSMLDAGLFPRLEQETVVKYLRRDPQKGLLRTLTEALGINPIEIIKKEQNQQTQEIQKLETLALEASPAVQQELNKLITNLKAKQKDIKSFSEKEKEERGLLEQWKYIEEVNSKPLIILLDQVEEAFTRPNLSIKDEIKHCLAQIYEVFKDPQNCPKGKLILSYRKEYHPEIEEECKNLQLPREHIFLKPLRKEGIEEIVSGLVSTEQLRRRYGLNVDAALPTVIADDLLEDTASSIAPVLQILLTKLWQKTEQDSSRFFTVELYNILKKEGILLGDYFNQQLEKLSAWNKEVEVSGLALDVLNMHTTKHGTAGTQTYAELAKRYPHQQAILDDLLQKFKELYLLSNRGVGITGLAHDTLANFVTQAFRNSDCAGQRAYRILDNKIINYRLNSSNLLDTQDLRIVEEGRSGMRSWTEEDKALIQKSQEKRTKKEKAKKIQRRVGIAITILIALLAIVAIYLKFQAEDSKDKSEADNLLFHAKSVAYDDATLALQLANQAYLTADKDQHYLAIMEHIYAYHDLYDFSLHHDFEVAEVTLSPDMDIISTSKKGNDTRIWDFKGKQLATLDGVLMDISKKDGRILTNDIVEYSIKLWDKAGNLIQVLPFAEKANFDPFGDRVLYYSKKRKITTLYKNEVIPQINIKGSFEKEQSIQGDLMLTSYGNQTLVWTTQGKLLDTLQGGDFSFFDKKIITSDANSNFLWDRQGRLIANFPNEIKALSADGRLIFAYNQTDNKTYVYNNEGKLLTSLLGVYREMLSHERIILTEAEGKVIAYDQKGSILQIFEGTFKALSPKHDRLLTLDKEDNKVLLWDLNGNSIRINVNNINLSFTGDGNWIVNRLPNQVFEIYTKDGVLLRTFPGKFKYYIPDEQCMLVAYNNKVHVWNLKNMMAVSGKILDPPNNPSLCIVQKNNEVVFADRSTLQTITTVKGTNPTLSPNGKFVAITQEDKVGLYTVHGGLIMEMQGNMAVFAPNSERLLSYNTSEGEGVQLWSVQGRLLASWQGYRGVFAQNNESILIDKRDEVNFYLPNSKQPITFKGTFVSCSVAGDQVMTLNPSKDSVIVWSSSSERIVIAEGTKGAFSINGDILIHGKSHTFWDKNGKQIKEFSPETTKALFTSDGKHIITEDYRVKVWSNQGDFITKIEGNSVQISNSGQYLLTFDGIEIRLWNINGKLVNRLTGIKASFSPNDAYILTQEPNKEGLMLWNLKGQLLKVVEDGENGYFSADGTSISIQRRNGSTYIINTPPDLQTYLANNQLPSMKIFDQIKYGIIGMDDLDRDGSLPDLVAVAHYLEQQAANIKSSAEVNDKIKYLQKIAVVYDILIQKELKVDYILKACGALVMLKETSSSQKMTTVYEKQIERHLDDMLKLKEKYQLEAAANFFFKYAGVDDRTKVKENQNMEEELIKQQHHIDLRQKIYLMDSTDTFAKHELAAAYAYKVWLLIQIGDMTNALLAMDLAIATDANDFMTLRNRPLSYLYSGKIKEAVAWYEKLKNAAYDEKITYKTVFLKDLKTLKRLDIYPKNKAYFDTIMKILNED